MSFSARRIAAGLTVDDVSREFRVPAASVQEWEEGSAQPPQHVVRSLDVIRTYGTTIVSSPKAPAPADVATTRPLVRRSDTKGRSKSSDSAVTLIKSKKRVADHGEVFTPPWLVENMLELVKEETERIDSRFLEPACGSGNFLVRILQRKLAAVELKYGKSEFEKRYFALYALTCCYGIELLPDNIAECRANMLEVFADYLGLKEGDDLCRAASHVLSLNLIHGDAMKMQAHDGSPMIVVEWGYIGKGKFMRRDFRLEDLAGASLLREGSLPFSDPKTRMVFTPVGVGRPMKVAELAAADQADAELIA
jgi:hypothetical protein